MKLVCLGDSFTVGPMVDPGRRWTSLLQEQTSADILNRGISGDTTSGMLCRLLPDCVGERPDRALLIGGANDLICCGSTDIVKNNFMAMIHQLFHHGIKPVIATPIPCVPEMISPLWQPVCDFRRLNEQLASLNEWSKGFSEAFLCNRLDLFAPMMQRLADPGDLQTGRSLYLDGLHLSEAGHAEIAAIMLPQLERILR
ncbi:MAG: hypothetical protein IJ109_05050 [Firmicutes bacterium]|nr:hypothetical protein [Bacillota bacterium]